MQAKEGIMAWVHEQPLPWLLFLGQPVSVLRNPVAHMLVYMLNYWSVYHSCSPA